MWYAILTITFFAAGVFVWYKAFNAGKKWAMNQGFEAMEKARREYEKRKAEIREARDSVKHDPDNIDRVNELLSGKR